MEQGQGGEHDEQARRQEQSRRGCHQVCGVEEAEHHAEGKGYHAQELISSLDSFHQVFFYRSCFMTLETARKYNGVIYLVFFVRPSARDGWAVFSYRHKKTATLGGSDNSLKL